MNPMVKCRICGNKMPVTGMVLDETTNGLLCRKCKSRGQTAAPIPKTRPVEKVEMPKGTKSFQCQNCSYKFKRVPKSSAVLRCPYCASDNVKETQNSAQKLIDEMADFEEQRFFK